MLTRVPVRACQRAPTDLSAFSRVGSPYTTRSRAGASTGPSNAIAHSNVATARSHGRRNTHAKQITSADSRAASRPKAVFVIHRLQRRPQFAHAAGGLSERSASRNDRYAAPFQISCSAIVPQRLTIHATD